MVGEAATIAVAEQLVEAQQPDVVLLDVRFDGEASWEGLQRMLTTSPDTRVVILTAHEDPTYVARAAVLGAADYLLKNLGRRRLINAVLAAAAGRTPTAQGILRPIAQRLAATDKSPPQPMALTQREMQVLCHVGLGLSNKEIASSLKISVQTVKEHMRHILAKIKASDRTAAAVWAIRKQLV